MSTKIILLIVSAFLFLGLAGFVQPKKSRTIANGMWGGDHVRMTINNGAARIEYDCANGTITSPLKIDSRGRFELRGIHHAEHGGPVRSDEEESGQPAKYTGWTDGKKMTLKVTLVNSKTEIGTFELTRGRVGQVFKCL
jgi:hypothetical protein